MLQVNEGITTCTAYNLLQLHYGRRVPPPVLGEAYVSVILKEGKDKLDCKSYRPINVLNSDYKLFASVLAGRLEKIMPLLIYKDQTGLLAIGKPMIIFRDSCRLLIS